MMSGRFYIMFENLYGLGYIHLPREFYDSLSNNNSKLNVEERKFQNNKLADIYIIIRDSNMKHFSHWNNGHLVKLSLWRECVTAQPSAN